MMQQSKIELINEHRHELLSQTESEPRLCHPRRQTEGQNKGKIITRILKKQKEPKILKAEYQTPHELYHADLIKQNLEESLVPIPNYISLLINQRIKFAEDEAYHGILGEDKKYLKRLYNDGGDVNFIKEAIEQFFGQIHNTIVSQINQGSYNVHHKIRMTKEELISGSPIKFKQIKQKLKDNLINLKVEMGSELQNFNNINFNEYDIESQKTKQAEQFTKKIMESKLERKKRREERLKLQQKMQVESMQERKEFQQKINKERHQELKERFERQQKQSKQHKQQIIRQEQQFKLFLKAYKKSMPVYKKKEKQFHRNFTIAESKKRLEQLTKIKLQRRPIHLSEIKQHAKRYQQFKLDHADQRQSLFQINEEERLKRIKKYYKGKFHKAILTKSQSKIYDSSDDEEQYDRTQLNKRRIQYSSQVKEKFKPKLSLAKQKQLQQLIQNMKWLEKSRAHSASINTHQEGNKNLQRLHQIIAELKAKGQIKKQQDYKTLIPPKPTYPNYLRQLQPDTYKTINYQTMASNNPDLANLKAHQLEQNAKRRQKVLNNAKSMNIEKYLEEKAKLDDDYLNSAKVKIAILNQLQ